MPQNFRVTPHSGHVGRSAWPMEQFWQSPKCSSTQDSNQATPKINLGQCRECGGFELVAGSFLHCGKTVIYGDNHSFAIAHTSVW
jgi:hypothetical protein